MAITGTSRCQTPSQSVHRARRLPSTPCPASVQISVGNVKIGGGAPVVVQSMTLTPTRDVEADGADRRARVRRVRDRPRCGRRARTPRRSGSCASRRSRSSRHPLQRQPQRLRSDRRGRRGRPDQRSSIGPTRWRRWSPQRSARASMRIGANSGSLPKHLQELARRDQAEALVAAAISGRTRAPRLPRLQDLRRATHVPTMIRAYRILAAGVHIRSTWA